MTWQLELRGGEFDSSLYAPWQLQMPSLPLHQAMKAIYKCGWALTFSRGICHSDVRYGFPFLSLTGELLELEFGIAYKYNTSVNSTSNH